MAFQSIQEQIPVNILLKLTQFRSFEITQVFYQISYYQVVIYGSMSPVSVWKTCEYCSYYTIEID